MGIDNPERLKKMSEKEYVVLIAIAALTLYISGIPFYVSNVNSCYRDKKSGKIFLVFCGLTIATLVGGFIYGIYKYRIGG